MGLLSYFYPHVIAQSHSKYNKNIKVIERFGKKELSVNGIQQSGSYTKKLWVKGMKNLSESSEKGITSILILGVSGGTLIPILRERYPESDITAVDIDAEIIRIYRTYFQEPGVLSVNLICNDATKIVITLHKSGIRYDMIIVDLFTGNDVPESIEQTAFHRGIRRLLTEGGIAAWNYFSYRNQQAKSEKLKIMLSSVYNSVQTKRILYNMFFYCS